MRDSGDGLNLMTLGEQMDKIVNDHIMIALI